ncbi:MAG: hypothetical protein JW803_06135 [Endomicrobiales bacterium]|nr:hypothetical protein [Endomicrobiales bacterium]
MITKCAWCGILIQSDLSAKNRAVSHGICSACRKKLFKKRSAYRTKNVRRDLHIRSKIPAFPGHAILPPKKLQEELAKEQGALEKDVAHMFEKINNIENRHAKLIFIRVVRQGLSSFMR